MRSRHLLATLSLSTVLTVALAGVALAAPPAAPAPPPASAAPRPAEAEAMRAEIRSRLRAHRTAQLIEELRLDEAGVARVVPVLRRFDEQLEPILLDLGTARRELKGALAAPTPDTATVNRLVDRMLAGRDRLERLSRERLVELRKAMTPVQFGRAVLVLAEIDRKVGKQLHRAMRKAMGAPGKPGKPGKRAGGRPVDPFRDLE